MKRLLVLAAGAAIGASAATPLAAQTGITDPVLKRIWTLGMDSSHTWDLAQTFFDSIGPRLTGTPQGNEASDWVMKPRPHSPMSNAVRR